jgi:hypothetical protein
VISPRIRDRLKALESSLTPKERRILVHFSEEGAPPAEQLAQFKAEKGVGPHDTLVTVVFTFDA